MEMLMLQYKMIFLNLVCFKICSNSLINPRVAWCQKRKENI